MDADAVYYRIVQTTNEAGGIVRLAVVTMQWFDEHDYDPARFFTDEKFTSEGDAIAFIEAKIAEATRLMPLVLSRLGIKF